MSRLFQAVKESVTALQAAERYGLHVNRAGMACCPFHQDTDPSLKLDNRFHCFGCGADGDVICFTSLLFSLSPLEAAKKLARDFGIEYGENQPPAQPKKTKPSKNATTKSEVIAKLDQAYADILRRYFSLLKSWAVDHAPDDENDEWHPLFCEALQNIDRVDYLISELWFASEEEKLELIKQCGEEIESYGERVRQYYTESVSSDSKDT